MHRHPLALVAMIASAMIVANFFVDVVASGLFPNSPAARGLKQSVTGA